MISDDAILDSYISFGMHFLTTPDLIIYFGQLDKMSSFINMNLLSSALIREFTMNCNDQTEPEAKLWLLAHFIFISRLKNRDMKYSEYLKALSLQLSSFPEDVLAKIEYLDSENAQAKKDTDNSTELSITVPEFVSKELFSLVTRESISELLALLNNGNENLSMNGEKDVSLVSSYALTLLKIFPHRQDEVRMWLYLGSIKAKSDFSIPAVKFFWQAMRSTRIFSSIYADSEAASVILSEELKNFPRPFIRIVGDREWGVVLLFLEIYAFFLRFTDDEEFLSGSTPDIGQGSRPVSHIRLSTLPIGDVKKLSIFLKNLAFSMNYKFSEFLGSTLFQIHDTTMSINSANNQPLTYVSKNCFNKVKSIVTGVMCMLYERDSRRKFLPKDHWLMTSELGMDGFIPAVAIEEENQNGRRDNDEDDEVDELESGFNPDAIEILYSGLTRQRHSLQSGDRRRRHKFLMRQKILTAIGPRLQVLQNMPFVIPFETRVELFRQFVLLDQIRRRGGHVDPDAWRRSILEHPAMRLGNRALGHEELERHHAKIRRNNIFEDAYEKLYSLEDGLKEPIQITFVDQFDTVEAGIDGGGVTKEFLTCITNEALCTRSDPKFFVPNDQNLLYPNPTVLDEVKEILRQEGHQESSLHCRESIKAVLQRFRFLGRIIGKCLYEGILVDIGFAGFFLLKWASSNASGSEYRANINDLRDLDEGLYQGLLQLKNYPGNVEDFSLDFTITDTIPVKHGPSKTITRDLMPDGSSISVVNENRPLYVSYVTRHRLQIQPYQQTRAFLDGLSDVISPAWISMFNQSELQTLISGDSSEIDVEDLRRNTSYSGVYQIGDDGEEHDTIKLFWKVMKTIDDSDRRNVLKYVTSSPRAPLLGFSQLNPLFTIRDSGSDEDRLPSTSTCVNLLKLPRYSSEDTLRRKLLYAVHSGAGFDLS